MLSGAHCIDNDSHLYCLAFAGRVIVSQRFAARPEPSMNAAESQDAGRTVTRRRHIIVARKHPADGDAPPVAQAVGPAPSAIGDTRMMTSEQLFAGQSAVAIRHNGAVYTLRVTRFGKLILTK